MNENWSLLREYLESRRDEARGYQALYRKNKGDLYANPDELAYGQESRENEIDLILAKMARLESTLNPSPHT